MYLGYIIWNISDDEYRKYRKLLLEPESDILNDTIQTIYRNKEGNICTRRKASIGATKRFFK